MSDDTKAEAPDSQDALWTEHEPDTERVSPSGEPVELTPEAYVAPRQPDWPNATSVTSSDDVPDGEISPLGTAISHDPASSQYIAVGPDPATPPKRRSRLMWAWIIGALGLLVAGAALTYNLWYQNPDKVLSDAVMHAVKSQSLTYNGAYAADFEGGRFVLDFDGNNPSAVSGQTNVRASLTMQGQTYKLNGTGLVDKDGTLYFKLSNVRSLLDSFAKQAGMTTASFDSLVSKIDGKWVKVTANDIKQVSPSTGNNQACFTAAFTRLDNDQVKQKELSDLYKKHKFITVDKKLGSATIADQQSLGYELSADLPKLKQFVSALNDTSLATDLKACDKSFRFNSDGISDNAADRNNSVLHVWINKWTHDFTKVTFDSSDTNKQKTALWVEPQFNNATPITTPSGALTIQQLQAEIQESFSGMMLGGEASVQASQAKTDALNVLKHVEAYNADMEVYPTLTQLKAGSKSVAKLPDDISGRIGSVTPSAANPTAIQYQLCAKATGAYISYFDTSSKTVERLTAGICAA